ncbi:MAG: YmdB family metallophosphoesterase [Epsilonproteobacteria bacterium]|nr:YmdB family metallophosphoesterase [Campylobacterota bacterium]OIO17447.1 MAG: metallophosphoesterase [Helicobacteraceae bacterium CG1_02_36_14]PIP10687.1 MAG: metallophosphoesterase [Sulfurimonas sp. CG23_combo_of_CG06-09_8_20_14_all_36_33]PIS25021.1 MAG: metallophosphoesterase [Sulfurimonas sp. CG08_land_8_20_14_0_20_36_33]PIU35151.1 MAG: metallophosphoesterase [Sulfurimonas sp. CG07_land_8_20_14_0_80_36_56]PIV03174.1 MAG: metallophosphoesterase [Sulfurimonas sp. CG03_land_8_20_14_0_80_36
MRVLFIGDIVGNPGREMIKSHLKRIKEEHAVDFVIANYENASHGFGLTAKNANELVACGIDVMSGGNHTWDKKDILPLLDSHEILRPHNYPSEVPGTGCKVYEVLGEKLAVLNLMGHYAMPYTDNAFRCALTTVEALHAQGVKNIFIDFHAEATSEKRAMLLLLQGKVSGIIGTHTHVSTDDFQIVEGTAYLTDIGLSGCRDNVIGMDEKVPLKQFLTGIKGHFDIPKKCKKVLQVAIMDFSDGVCSNAFKLKYFDDGRVIETKAWMEA